jgi:hypothetical protein
LLHILTNLNGSLHVLTNLHGSLHVGANLDRALSDQPDITNALRGWTVLVVVLDSLDVTRHRRHVLSCSLHRQRRVRVPSSR